jgi:hypothetical protein
MNHLKHGFYQKTVTFKNTVCVSQKTLAAMLQKRVGFDGV